MGGYKCFTIPLGKVGWRVDGFREPGLSNVSGGFGFVVVWHDMAYRQVEYQLNWYEVG